MIDERPVASTELTVQVSKKDLPLSCPSKASRHWDSHPRVFLPIEEAGGKVDCPYCGVKYILNELN
jgi:uncharacterized Zn-finger protein